MNDIQKTLLEKVGSGKFNAPQLIESDIPQTVNYGMVENVANSVYGRSFWWQRINEARELIGNEWRNKEGKFTKRLKKYVSGIAETTGEYDKDITPSVKHFIGLAIDRIRDENVSQPDSFNQLFTDLLGLEIHCPRNYSVISDFPRFLELCAHRWYQPQMSKEHLVESLTSWLGQDWGNGGVVTKKTGLLFPILCEKIERNCMEGGKISWRVSLTNDIFWKDGDFGKDDSCWWGCYGESIPAFLENGGWGLLWHKASNSWRHGIGRCWLGFPSDDAIFLFNQYGQDENGTGIRISDTARFLAHLMGSDYTYYRGYLHNKVSDSIPYINGNSGYFIAPKSAHYEDGKSFHVDWHWAGGKPSPICTSCGERVDEEDGYFSDDGDFYCENCYCDIYSHCSRCGAEVNNDDGYTTDNGNFYCERCYTRYFTICHQCGEQVRRENVFEGNGDDYCEACYSELYANCEDCGESILVSDMVSDGGLNFYCQSCASHVPVMCQ